MSHFWMTKDGQIQGANSEVDTQTKLDLSVLTRRYNTQHRQAADVGNISATLTAADMRKGILTTNPGVAINLTTATAALLKAADPDAAVGRGFEFTVINLNGVNAATLVAGVGVTLVGSAVVALSTSANFYARYTNVDSGTEAITIYRI
jgi:hypothetical protein